MGKISNYADDKCSFDKLMALGFCMIFFSVNSWTEIHDFVEKSDWTQQFGTISNNFLQIIDMQK